MSKICVLGGDLCFSASGELERYRIESLLSKEPETIAWIDSWERGTSPIVFFDIGANIGIYSLYAGYRHRCSEVFCFEPVSNNFAALQKNVLINSMENIYPFNFALGEREGVVNLYLCDIRVGNSGAQIGHAVNEKGQVFEPQRVEKILCISGDQLLKVFGLSAPTHIKIDVDGHETDILNGMGEMLASPSLRSILVEFNNDDEFKYWRERLGAVNLHVDVRFDSLPNHSRFRRIDSGSLARNYIFSRGSI